MRPNIRLVISYRQVFSRHIPDKTNSLVIYKGGLAFDGSYTKAGLHSVEALMMTHPHAVVATRHRGISWRAARCPPASSCLS
jgi:hypothetical protein